MAVARQSCWCRRLAVYLLATGTAGVAHGQEREREREKESQRCPISTGLLVQPMKARPCGHVYSAASARAYFTGPGGKKCAVFGCDKVLKWSDFVEDEASEIALRATTQDHVPHQPLSDPYQSLAAPIQAPAAPVAPPVAAVAPPAPLFQAPPPAVAAPAVSNAATLTVT